MNIEHFQWYSNRVGVDMHIIRYGHWGPPMIYFPTSGGGHTEFDYYRLQDDTWWFIENGKIQFFAIDGYSWNSWYNRGLHPAEKVRNHIRYEKYVIEELIPFIRNVARNDYIGCMGASFGGYLVMNTTFKHPEIFKFALALGGVFDISDFLGGYHDDNVYFNNPVEYIPNLTDPYYLNQLGHTTKLVLMCGENDKFLSSTIEFHNILKRKGIPHHYEVWPAPCDHHEFWWKKQIPYILGKYYV